MIKHNIEWKYVKNDGSRLYPVIKAYEQYTNKKSDVIITISMNDYKYMINHYRDQKVYYVPHQVNTRLFNPLGDAYPFTKDKLNILFYGSLDRPMNIAALRFIKQQLIPSIQRRGLMGKVRINIFGSGTPPKDIGIETDPNINYLGQVDDPGYYIRGADVVIVPIKNNGGLKIRMLESLYCGKPVIATSEAVDGLSGPLQQMVITRNSANGFTNAIQEFVKTKRTKKHLVRNDQFWKYQMKGTSMNYIIHTAVRKNT
jgi:glycosyltransferase involved in cell wall biosynthesis